MAREFFRSVAVSLLTGLVLSLAGGCVVDLYRSVKHMVVEPEPIDSSLVAEFWDGPKIGPGMHLIITVGSVTTKPVSMDVLVDQKGEITLQHLLEAPVPCDKMTLEELRGTLVKAYSVYYRKPKVTVTFGKYDGQGVSPWGTVRVMGEVGKQGPVNMPPTSDLTVTKVLQLAGGAKQYADTSAIKVTRCDREGRQTVTVVDLVEIGKYGRFDKDMLLKAGDVVYVPATWY